MRLLLRLAFALVATAAFGAESAIKPAIVAIKAAHLISPQTGTVLTNSMIVIEGDKVKQVGTVAELTPGLPGDTKIIDLGDATILPGLIDCHTHVTSQPEDYYADRFRKSPIDVAIVAHVYARRTLEAGSTTIRTQVGQLSPGYFPDLIAVRADPLADITVLEKIPFVLKGGAIVKDEITGK